MRFTLAAAAGPLILLLASAVSAQDVSSQSVRFNFFQCSDEQKKTINAAWDDALNIANVVYSNDPKWKELPENDFLGNSDLNKDSQDDIKKVLQNAATFTKASFFNPLPWFIDLHCDDVLRDAVSGKGGCSTKAYPKKTAAYTLQENNPFSKQPIIGFCPIFFNVLKSCQSRLDQYGKSKRLDFQLDLNNYQCQGYAVLHEIFHLDWESKVGNQGHISDKAFPVRREYDNKIVNVPAYGPENTKILSQYDSNDVGKFVATNADNLAQYSLAKYVQSKIKKYPHDPRTGLHPEGDPFDQQVRYIVEDGQLTLLTNFTIGQDANAVIELTTDGVDELSTLCSDMWPGPDGGCDPDNDIVKLTKFITTVTNTEASDPTPVPASLTEISGGSTAAPTSSSSSAPATTEKPEPKTTAVTSQACSTTSSKTLIPVACLGPVCNPQTSYKVSSTCSDVVSTSTMAP